MHSRQVTRDYVQTAETRRFNHRRIHTLAEQPANNKYPLYNNCRPPNKQYSRPKFLDANTNRPTNKELGVKTLRFNKPSLVMTRNPKTDSKDHPTDSVRSKNHPTDSVRSKNLRYEIEGVAGRGTFGVVFSGSNRLTGERVALKKVLQDKKYKNRELDILKQIKHQNILEMKDHFFTQENDEEFLNVVMEYYPQNLYQTIKRKELTPLLIKLYAYQIIRGLNYLSMLSISHRDIKPQNILVDKNKNTVVICDFGSAKKLVRGEPNIAYICSRCYRAPQLIFGATEYTTQIDMWSTGCVLVQMINGEAPFLGDSQIDQLLQILKILGTPSRNEIQEMNPKYDLRQYKKFPAVKATPWNKILKTDDPLLVDLVKKIMEYSPYKRLTAAEALKHPYFQQLKDLQNLKSLKKVPALFNFTQEQKQSLTGVQLQNDDQVYVDCGSIQLEERKTQTNSRKRSEMN